MRDTSHDWPALMDEKTAAAYLGLGAASARAWLRRAGVRPVELGLRARRWRRSDVDAALEGLPARDGTSVRDSCATQRDGVDSALAAVARRIAFPPRSRKTGQVP
jgi:hypothetical protein